MKTTAPAKLSGFSLCRSLLLLAAVLGTSVTIGQGATILGDTTGQPVWNRPIEGNPPVAPLSLTTAVPYQVIPFGVTVSGNYDFVNTADNNWDNYFFVYQDDFDPLDPLTNAIIGNDDLPTGNVGVSGFSGVPLTAFTQYYAVTTGFLNTDFGEYELTIEGQGRVLFIVIPEPSRAVLVLVGVLGCLVRRARPSSLS